MIYITIPKKIRMESKSEIKRLNDICSLLSKHGYGAVRFGKDTFGKDSVEFYKKQDMKGDSVPAHFYYKMCGKEFIAFLDVLQRLEISDNKILKYIKWVNTVL
jgi:hypothetical protein